MTSPRTITHWTVALLLLVAAATHVPLVSGHLEEAPYVGILFLALIVACTGLAVLILVHDSPPVWALSAGVCLLAVVAFLASRTVGLPQLPDDIGMWTDEPMSFPAVASEALVVVLAVAHLTRTQAQTAPASGGRRKVTR